MLIFFVTLTLCFILFIAKKGFRILSIGLSSILIYGMIYLHFYTNQKFASVGSYETFKLKSIHLIDNKHILNIDCSRYGSSTEVTVEKFLKVDSVQLRIDNGLMGMKIISNDVRIEENKKCIVEESTLNENLSEIINKANELQYSRCFNDAINQYSRLIKYDSDNFKYYYERALIYMIKGQYEIALKDLINSFAIKYKLNEGIKIETVESQDKMKPTKKLIESFNNNEFKDDDLIEYIGTLNNMVDYDSYKTRILHCLKELAKI